MGKRRLEHIFKTKKDRLSLYLTVGYPEIESMPICVEAMVESEVDFIELGMPYSDPLADGNTIQRSSMIALANGITIDLYFDQVIEARSKTDIPLIFMGYFNQVLRYGIERFLNRCVEVGIDGIILPDLPPEIYEADYLRTFEIYDLAMIFLVTPTCSEARIRYIDGLSSGFVYVVSSSSTTGNKGSFSEEQMAYLKRIKTMQLSNPAVAGFGISDHSTYQTVNKYIDGAIVGSAYINVLNDDNDLPNTTKTFVAEIKKGN